jgi:hypothetical protein
MVKVGDLVVVHADKLLPYWVDNMHYLVNNSDEHEVIEVDESRVVIKPQMDFRHGWAISHGDYTLVRKDT